MVYGENRVARLMRQNQLVARRKLNVIENWNGANDFILYGRGGDYAETALLCRRITDLVRVKKRLWSAKKRE